MSVKIFAKSFYNKLKRASIFNPSLPMLTPIIPRLDSKLKNDFRLNIVVPTLNPQHVFGGITTALKFYETLAETIGGKCRMIVSDEATYEEYLCNYPGYVLCDAESDSSAKKQIVPFSDRAKKTLPVGENDLFITTAWWTAFVTDSVLSYINKNFGFSFPMVYFIQDYEPFFYPWSSFSSMAESTYHFKKDVIAVFNSHELQDYFKIHNYSFFKEFYFDPVLNSALKKEIIKNPPKIKEKKILVYGRPSVARNCMELVAESLRKWAVLADDALEWELISAGEKHPPLVVGNGCTLKSVGKLTIENYAKLMSSCYAGISLMISPHPSYPPLEMSTFGIKTITNTYENKDLKNFNNNIISMSNFTPEEIAEELVKITNNFSKENFNIADNTNYFKNNFSFEKICLEIKEILNK